MTTVQKFYNNLQFPGRYTLDGLKLHDNMIVNPYLRFINKYLSKNATVLDVGCGTGLITNLFARKYPSSQFTGIDFSDSIDYARNFAREHQLLSNVTFLKSDFNDFTTNEKYKVVICQGVLHHMPNYSIALEHLLSLVKPQGILLLGVYHPWGKIIKKYLNVNYKNNILYMDQECNPFETSFTYNQVKEMCHGFKIVDASHTLLNTVSLPAFFNYRNGGLVTYALEKI